jgi:hypothetical protein
MARPWLNENSRDQLRILSAVRLCEIETIIRARHGYYLPDPSGTDDEDLVHAYVTAAAGTLMPVRGWARRWAPWLVDETVLRRAEALQRKLLHGRAGPKLLPADAVAKMLLVRMVERDRLGLKTIGACDVTPEQRAETAKARKRERDRLRQMKKRIADGRLPREQYVAGSIEASQPWLAEGISRRTWYRRNRGTGSSRAKIDINGSDTPVPTTSGSDQSSDPSWMEQTIEGSNDTETEGRRSGSGDKSPAGGPGGGASWRELRGRAA